MNTHEYQAKKILKEAGIPLPAYGVACKQHEVEHVLKELHLKEGVVKIQVHAGGRGKGGGVKICKTPEEIAKFSSQLLGMKLINEQTGPEGVIAHKVLISELTEIQKEYYIAVVLDRKQKGPVLIASPAGGMEIEEIAARHPKKIVTLPVLLNGKIRTYHLLRLTKFMGWEGEVAKEGMKIASILAKVFVERDASLLEINPLVLDKKGQLWALDAKLSVDDNALFRQPEIASFYDASQHTQNEIEAKKYDLAYIALDGNIGCMVNGAGLAMATMDLIKYAGGKPANFLDVGGGATADKIAEGFKILASDSKVKAILINIFGGIMSCATIAEGILAALQTVSVKVPLVVRMEGTNVETGKKMLQESKLPVTTADDLADAAKKIVEALHGHTH